MTKFLRETAWCVVVRPSRTAEARRTSVECHQDSKANTLRMAFNKPSAPKEVVFDRYDGGDGEMQPTGKYMSFVVDPAAVWL